MARWLTLGVMILGCCACSNADEQQQPVTTESLEPTEVVDVSDSCISEGSELTFVVDNGSVPPDVQRWLSIEVGEHQVSVTAGSRSSGERDVLIGESNEQLWAAAVKASEFMCDGTDRLDGDPCPPGSGGMSLRVRPRDTAAPDSAEVESDSVDSCAEKLDPSGDLTEAFNQAAREAEGFDESMWP